MSEHTPTTEEVRTDYVLAYTERESSQLAAGRDFDRWLAAHDAEVRADVAEKIAKEAERHRDDARRAHRSAETDHLAHDYCRWVGHAQAAGALARIAREHGGEQP